MKENLKTTEQYSPRFRATRQDKKRGLGPWRRAVYIVESLGPDGGVTGEILIRKFRGGKEAIREAKKLLESKK